MTDQRKMVVTLGPEAAACVRKIANERDIIEPEVIRRGLMLLTKLYGLEDKGEIMGVINTKTGAIDRLRTDW